MRSLPATMKMSKMNESSLFRERKTRSYVVWMRCLNVTMQCNAIQWLAELIQWHHYSHTSTHFLSPVSWQYQVVATFCTCIKQYAHALFHVYQRIKSDGLNRFYHFAWINTQTIRTIGGALFVCVCVCLCNCAKNDSSGLYPKFTCFNEIIIEECGLHPSYNLHVAALRCCFSCCCRRRRDRCRSFQVVQDEWSLK